MIYSKKWREDILLAKKSANSKQCFKSANSKHGCFESISMLLHHASPSQKWNKPIYLSIKWNWKNQFSIRFSLRSFFLSNGISFSLFFDLYKYIDMYIYIKKIVVGSLFYFYCLVMSSHSYRRLYVNECVCVCTLVQVCWGILAMLYLYWM